MAADSGPWCLMIERNCANPLCSQVLEDFGRGKLFVFEAPLDDVGETGEQCHAAKYFWLCQDCASVMTLMSDLGQEPVVICLGTEQYVHLGTA